MQSPWAALIVPPDLDGRTLELFCELMVLLNEDYLRRHPDTPPLYLSGARYRQQPEFWLTIPWALEATRAGQGVDCKVLATWRVAELRVRGYEPAHCVWSAHPTADKLVYHVRVRRADGQIEDPSLALGMNAALPARRGAAAWNLSRLLQS